jgi:Bacterial Ig-like domain (group 2)/Divergent InlB B-repeat domain
LSIRPRAFPHGTRNQNDQRRFLNSLGLVRDLALICAVLSLSALEGCVSRALTSIQITPAAGSETVSINQTAQFHALGVYTANNHESKTQDVTDETTWTSSNTAVATINSTGLATAVAAGTATITGSLKGNFGIVTASSSITVTSAPATRTLASLAIIPGSQSVAVIGETAQFLAIGTYNATPLTQDLTNQVRWVSSDVKIAQISTVGLVTTVGNGSVTITALATDPNSGVFTASATVDATDTPTGSVLLPTLTIYKVGNGTGTVTGTGSVTSTVVIDCGSGAQCIGNFPLGSMVTLTATPGSGSVFDGWSANCAPKTANSCTLSMTNNDAVGAVFDVFNP